MADAMRTNPLGTDELRVSVVGLGCNNFGRKGSATEDLAGTDAVLGACLDHGVTFLDTADIYGGRESMSEQLMGRALKGRRDRVVLATKWGSEFDLAGAEEWGPRAARTYIRHAVDGSLRRLQTDWIDLFQLHVPHPETPIEDTLEALAELKAEGKIRFYGHSNFSAAELREADDAARAKGLPPFVSEQSEYSLLARGAEEELLPAVTERKLGFLPFFPLASGLLTGKYSRGHAPAGSRLSYVRKELLETTDFGRLAAYGQLAEERGMTMTEATIAWLLAQTEVSSVIAGATTPEQVAANAKAGHVRLDDDTVAEIAAIFR